MKTNWKYWYIGIILFLLALVVLFNFLTQNYQINE